MSGAERTGARRVGLNLHASGRKFIGSGCAFGRDRDPATGQRIESQFAHGLFHDRSVESHVRILMMNAPRAPGSTIVDVGIYLDHAATTPVREQVMTAMNEVYALHLGNPSSRHTQGRAARRLLDDARDEVAAFVGFAPSELVFTSGATESNDLAIHGISQARAGVPICSAIEHEAVLQPVAERHGQQIAVQKNGLIDLDDLRDTLTRFDASTPIGVVSIMMVNNENGVAQPLDEVKSLVDQYAPGTPVHTDAVQGALWFALSERSTAVDAISISGHKVGAPAGIGALGIRSHIGVVPRVRGGGQENERRGGTQNVAGAVGLACALRLAALERDETVARVTRLRDRLADTLCQRIAGAVEPARIAAQDRSNTVGGIVQLCIPGVESESLLYLLDEAGLHASAGSACAAGALQASHVLKAMGVDENLMRGTLRLSIGSSTTDDDVSQAIALVTDAVDRLRGLWAA